MGSFAPDKQPHPDRWFKGPEFLVAGKVGNRYYEACWITGVGYRQPVILTVVDSEGIVQPLKL